MKLGSIMYEQSALTTWACDSVNYFKSKWTYGCRSVYDQKHI